MGRKQSSVLDSELYDTNEWFFVVQWITHRFDEEELSPSHAFVMSEPVGVALEMNNDYLQAHDDVRLSWRRLQKKWSDGWSADYNGKLNHAHDYFQSLVVETNQWIDSMFPSNGRGSGLERKRLLAAVRQQRLREKRREIPSQKAIQVSISGELYKRLRKHWQIPDSKQHDVVRAALQIVLDSPELLTLAKESARINK